MIQKLQYRILSLSSTLQGPGNLSHLANVPLKQSFSAEKEAYDTGKTCFT